MFRLPFLLLRLTFLASSVNFIFFVDFIELVSIKLPSSSMNSFAVFHNGRVFFVYPGDIIM